MGKAKRRYKQALTKYQRTPETQRGTLGNVLGIVAVPNQPDMVYVIVPGLGVREVKNTKVANIPGTPVKIGYDPLEPNIFQVLDTASYPQTYNAPQYTNSVGTHGSTHNWAGNDTVWVEKRQLMPLRITPIGAMSVFLSRDILWNTNQWVEYSGQTLDLTSAIPSTGSRYALIYGSLGGGYGILTGTTRDLLTMDISDIPYPLEGSIPLAAIRLYGGQTGVAEGLSDTDIIDVRRMFDPIRYPTPPSTLFLHNDAADVGGYEQLLTYPTSGSENSDDAVCSVPDTEYLIDSYITYPETGINVPLIQGGVWYFETFWSVDDGNVGVTNGVIRVYKRTSGGAETELFSVTTQQITSTVAAMIETSVTVSDIALDLTDRIVVKYYAKTTSVPTRTVTLYYEGTVHYSRIHTPVFVQSGSVATAASGVTADTTNFDHNLSSADDTVQKALETLDELVAGTGMANPMTALNDIIYGGISGTAQRLGIGSDNQVLTLVSGTMSWATPAIPTLTFHGAKVYNNANLSIDDSSATLLTMNTEVYDTDAYHSTSTNTGRMTIPAGLAGYYNVIAGIVWQYDGDGAERQLFIQKGATKVAMNALLGIPATPAAASTAQMVSVDLYLAEGDYVAAYALQRTGGTINIYHYEEYTPMLSIKFLGT